MHALIGTCDIKNFFDFETTIARTSVPALNLNIGDGKSSAEFSSSNVFSRSQKAIVLVVRTGNERRFGIFVVIRERLYRVSVCALKRYVTTIGVSS